ncbi:MAG: hypothetical protein ABSE71_00925 [Candidatus Micrarchaeaceae archaeon]|jgi:hypothetical protein|nr:hypothetical protein [Candidatus Micrarchaeota archaeon]HII10242.1 hypothetical protein [Candidatus Micrarchaeota archaeon]
MQAMATRANFSDAELRKLVRTHPFVLALSEGHAPKPLPVGDSAQELGISIGIKHGECESGINISALIKSGLGRSVEAFASDNGLRIAYFSTRASSLDAFSVRIMLRTGVVLDEENTLRETDRMVEVTKELLSLLGDKADTEELGKRISRVQ